MAETKIHAEHLPVFARIEHIGEYLMGEQQRLRMELAHVEQQLARLNAELHPMLQRGYGLDSQHVPVQIDTTRGVLVTHEPDELRAAVQNEPS